MSVLIDQHPIIEKDTTPQFFVNSHGSMKAATLRSEGAFMSPAFGSNIPLTESVSPRLTRTAAITGGHAQIRLTVLALAQGDSASASTRSTNPPPGGSTPSAKKKSSKWIWIAVAAGGAAAALALTMKKSSATSGTESVSMTPTGPTITLGTPTVGPQ